MTLEEYKEKCNDYSIWYSHLPEPEDQDQFEIINKRFEDEYRSELIRNKESGYTGGLDMTNIQKMIESGMDKIQAASKEFERCLRRNEAMTANHRHCLKFNHNHSNIY